MSAISGIGGPSEDDFISNASFEFIKNLGEGCFGKIHLVKKKSGKDEGVLYALKQPCKKRSRNFFIYCELEVMKAIRGLTFLSTLVYNYFDESNLKLVIEFYPGGDLAELLIWTGKLSLTEALHYARELVCGVATLHDLKIIHRDLKPDNVLIDSEGHLVISDFGLSYMFYEGETERLKKGRGCINYRAPETIGPFSDYSYESDWWSLGCVIFEMFYGRPPFYVDYGSNRYADVTDRIKHLAPVVDNSLSKETEDFLSSILCKSPRFRLGANGVREIKEHPFFSATDWAEVMAKDAKPPFVPPFPYRKDKNDGSCLKSEGNSTASTSSSSDSGSLGFENSLSF